MDTEDRPKINEGKVYVVWVTILVISQAFIGDEINGAGVAILLMLMGLIVLLFAPPIHIYFAKKNNVSNIAGHAIIVFVISLLVIVVFFIFVITGFFNFM